MTIYSNDPQDSEVNVVLFFCAHFFVCGILSCLLAFYFVVAGIPSCGTGSLQF